MRRYFSVDTVPAKRRSTATELSVSLCVSSFSRATEQTHKTLLLVLVLLLLWPALLLLLLIVPVLLLVFSADAFLVRVSCCNYCYFGGVCISYCCGIPCCCSSCYSQWYYCCCWCFVVACCLPILTLAMLERLLCILRLI